MTSQNGVNNNVPGKKFPGKNFGRENSKWEEMQNFACFERHHYLPQIISPILRALADENEYVRDTAYMAGKRLVTTYAETSLSLLLPELEKGLFDENWRIRHQSIQLLGDLLYKISGVTGKMTTETAGEDENFGTEQSQRVIIRLLGMERRDRVLAGLYMGRSDVALMVRQAALHVWKVRTSDHVFVPVYCY